MLQQRTTLAAAKQLKPLTQGTLSKLCGLYAFLNAVQLALYPRRLSRAELQSIYVQGISHLAGHRHLKRVLGKGMNEDVWLELWQALTAAVNADLHVDLACRFILKRPARTSLPRALQAVEDALLDGYPVLACFGGALDHLTVISGCTSRRLTFFDSSGLGWVTTGGLSLLEGENRHWLMRTSVVALVDGW